MCVRVSSSSSLSLSLSPQKLLELCSDDGVTLLCTVTSYLSRKYPKVYPVEKTLLTKALHRITPERTAFMHISPKISTSRPLQSKESTSPRNLEAQANTTPKSTSPRKKNRSFYQLDKVVNHSALIEPKVKPKFGRPISYERTAAKASVSNELQGMR